MEADPSPLPTADPPGVRRHRRHGAVDEHGYSAHRLAQPPDQECRAENTSCPPAVPQGYNQYAPFGSLVNLIRTRPMRSTIYHRHGRAGAFGFARMGKSLSRQRGHRASAPPALRRLSRRNEVRLQDRHLFGRSLARIRKLNAHGLFRSDSRRDSRHLRRSEENSRGMRA